MAVTGTIVPQSMNVSPHPAGEAVILKFEDGEHRVDVVIARNHIPLLLSKVQSETRLEPPQMLDPNSLEIGGIIQSIGHEFRRLPDKGLRMTFQLVTDDGGRCVPIHLSPETVAELAEYIAAT